MKTTSLKIFATLSILFSSQLFASGDIDCSSQKRQMKVLCADYMAERCEFFSDCFKRRDSCGKGTEPKNAGECMELNECHRSLMEQYPSNFSENTLCEYQWVEDDKDASRSWCRMRRGHGGENAVCPGDRRPGGAFVNWLIKGVSGKDALDSAVDDFNCGSLVNYYRAKSVQCENIREEFKSACIISEEDKVAYEESRPAKCEYYKNFKKYKQGSMRLNVRMESVHDGGRRAKSSDDSSSRDSERSRGAVAE